jgi:hypothetical protein
MILMIALGGKSESHSCALVPDAFVPSLAERPSALVGVAPTTTLPFAKRPGIN